MKTGRIRWRVLFVIGCFLTVGISCRSEPDTAESINTLQATDRETGFAKLAERNRNDANVREAIDKVVTSPAYRLYYKQFKNVTAEIHRNILYHLPYSAINSPGDISRNLQLLCRRKGELAEWAERVLPQIDLQQCYDAAVAWLPKGSYRLPTVYFLYDGNGDAFAHEGAVGFDLYGAVFSRYSPNLDNLDSIGVSALGPIISHELHHIFSPMPGVGLSTGYARVISSVQHRLVSEGVAKQIDGLRLSQQPIYEDSQIIRNWIAQLNEKLVQVKASPDSTSAFSEWLGKTYQELAVAQLREYISRMVMGTDLDKEVRRQGADRPSMVYTLGWFMIRTISNQGTDKLAAIDLLSEPDRLFETYNAVIGANDSTLRIVW